MKYSKLWLTFCVVLSCSLNIDAQNVGQVGLNSNNSDSLGRTVMSDTASKVYLPFRIANKRDVTGAISVLNPESYIDRDYNV